MLQYEPLCPYLLFVQLLPSSLWLQHHPIYMYIHHNNYTCVYRPIIHTNQKLNHIYMNASIIIIIYFELDLTKKLPYTPRCRARTPIHIHVHTCIICHVVTLYIYTNIYTHIIMYLHTVTHTHTHIPVFQDDQTSQTPPEGHGVQAYLFPPAIKQNEKYYIRIPGLHTYIHKLH